MMAFVRSIEETSKICGLKAPRALASQTQEAPSHVVDIPRGIEQFGELLCGKVSRDGQQSGQLSVSVRQSRLRYCCAGLRPLRASSSCFIRGIVDVHRCHSCHCVCTTIEIGLSNEAPPLPFLMSVFCHPRPLIPLSVVGREGSAGGVRCPALLPMRQGRGGIARRNPNLAAGTLPPGLQPG